MKNEIHPEYFITKVMCSGCGSAWETGSTIQELKLDICSQCHPYYTGEQKLVDTAGRVERFRKRYDKKNEAEEAPESEAEEAPESEVEATPESEVEATPESEIKENK